MTNNDVRIDWDDAREVSRANWDDRVDVHLRGYGIEAFDDPAHLSTVVVADLAALARVLPGGVDGLDVCHLQCHIGTDTISLARAGARVTGLDFSRPALDAAAALADRHGHVVRWVQSDVLDAADAIQDEFDLVYTSIGAICWLDDLERWARQVAALLRPGGTFFIRDGHPVLYALDETADSLEMRYSYFGDGRAQTWNDGGTYAGEGSVEHTRTYEWPHPLSEIVNALIGAGLTLRRLDEGRTLPWQFSPRMVPAPSGWAWPAHERDIVPCTFTIIATKS
ncbi:class I SAM-dependent methyltransferase [Microbacterium karelineae]|uniref:class I SAM-dependent methyltransferase n=1 Tax=Microbacterium karelineae TaxID=2654283 RepID=UPI0012EA4149|nr:class I SAM-dependent methyltransferase [Microbacterium karelineae]